MATKMLRRNIMYKNNFKAVIQHFRAFSCDGYKVVGGNKEVTREWPDTKLGNFSPHDKNYPLPGFTKLSHEPPAPIIRVDIAEVQKYENTRKLIESLPEEHYHETLRQVEEKLEDDG